MNRLTFEINEEGMFVKKSDVETWFVKDGIIHTGDAIRKLAEYEDLEEQQPYNTTQLRLIIQGSVENITDITLLQALCNIVVSVESGVTV